MSNSEKPKFAFGGKTEDKEDNIIQPVGEETTTETVAIPSKTEEDLNVEYTDRRSVTIALVRNYSLYRRVNDKALANRRDFIGSSINSSTVLSSNKTEIETYFDRSGIRPLK